MKLLSLFSLSLLLNFNQVLPTIAQVPDNSKESETSSEIPPSFGTVPGIYYDPEPGLSPSLSQMSGSPNGGSVKTDYKNLNYNIERVWQSGSTPDKIIKVGDLENDPKLKGIIEVEKLSLRKIAENGGADIETAPLKNIGLINSMTINEFLQVFPKYQNQPIRDFSIIVESINNADKMLDGSARERVLTKAEKAVIERLINEPMFENIPITTLAKGDWEQFVNLEEQKTLAEVIKKYPELEKVPINKLFPTAEKAVVQDWNFILKKAKQVAVERGTEIATSELLEIVPELGDAPIGALPIDELLVKDIEGLADVALERVPNISNRYLSQLGNLSETSQSMLVIDMARIPLTGDVFGKLDIPFAGEVETPITRVLSGGTANQIFLPEPCLEKSCKHFEIVEAFSGFAEVLNGIGKVQGKAWVQGSSQDVPGGKGLLRSVNGGKERTGVSVWTTNSHVKLSLEDINEGGNGEPATARIWLDFQICIYPPFLGEHCTPHFLSFATPWKVKEGGVMLVFSSSSFSDLIEYGRDRTMKNRNTKTEK